MWESQLIPTDVSLYATTILWYESRMVYKKNENSALHVLFIFTIHVFNQYVCWICYMNLLDTTKQYKFSEKNNGKKMCEV